MAGAKPSDPPRAKKRRRRSSTHLIFLRPRHPFLKLHSLRRRQRRRRVRRERPCPASPLANERPSGSGGASEEGTCDFGEGTCDFEEVYEPGGPLTVESLMNGIRLRYVQGLQLVIQLQCEALVRSFGVGPLICGVVGGVWMRLLAASRVFDVELVKEAVEKWERSRRDDAGKGKGLRGKSRPRRFQSRNNTKHCHSPEKSLSRIWMTTLKHELPLRSSLAVSFLACHVTRQSVLPNDIVKWALEAKLPYISAFLEVEKLLGKPSSTCSLPSKVLFKPVTVIGAWQLESMAGSVAQKIGLRVPPVNFYAIAYRYIERLSLPVEKILPSACRIYEWSLPVELCLSVHRFSLPSRVYVMAILMVTMRILYNMNGQGICETSLSAYCKSSASRKCSVACQSGNINKNYMEGHNLMNLDDTYHLDDAARDKQINDGDMENTGAKSVLKDRASIQDSGFNTSELLRNLKAAYGKINDIYDYSEDFSTYLKYCKDVISAGRRRPSKDEDLMEQFWNIYGQKVDNTQFEDTSGSHEYHRKRSREAVDEECADGTDDANVEVHVESKSGCQLESAVDASIRRFKSDMEENGFNYIPPKVQKVPENVYVQYYRKKQWGKLFYVAHADYYILLRTCARLAEVDCRILHLGVLCFEKRINWIEERIGKSLVSLRDNMLEDMIYC